MMQCIYTRSVLYIPFQSFPCRAVLETWTVRVDISSWLVCRSISLLRSQRRRGRWQWVLSDCRSEEEREGPRLHLGDCRSDPEQLWTWLERDGGGEREGEGEWERGRICVFILFNIITPHWIWEMKVSEMNNNYAILYTIIDTRLI